MRDRAGGEAAGEGEEVRDGRLEGGGWVEGDGWMEVVSTPAHTRGGGGREGSIE